MATVHALPRQGQVHLDRVFHGQRSPAVTSGAGLASTSCLHSVSLPTRSAAKSPRPGIRSLNSPLAHPGP